MITEEGAETRAFFFYKTFSLCIRLQMELCLICPEGFDKVKLVRHKNDDLEAII